MQMAREKHNLHLMHHLNSEIYGDPNLQTQVTYALDMFYKIGNTFLAWVQHLQKKLKVKCYETIATKCFLPLS